VADRGIDDQSGRDDAAKADVWLSRRTESRALNPECRGEQRVGALRDVVAVVRVAEERRVESMGGVNCQVPSPRSLITRAIPVHPAEAGKREVGRSHELRVCPLRIDATEVKDRFRAGLDRLRFAVRSVSLRLGRVQCH